MPRSARVFIENACYHIIARGNQKQEVFFETVDYEKYLQLLKKYKTKYHFKLYGYCLMNNHVHMVIDPGKPREISKAIQGLNLSYSIWFNAKYDKIGHLWQDRFKSMVIEKNDYLITCINYIEANPVRGNIVNSPLDYLWSSYKERIFDIKNGVLDVPELF
ncbi:MAG: transposase [Candidatus Omnitrophota bacterium]|jgi:putative transposase